MKLNDYLEWWEFSELVKDRSTNRKYLAGMRAALSEAGVVAILVSDFVGCFKHGVMDVDSWLDGQGKNADDRAETDAVAQSLEAIGAVRVAAKLRAGKDRPRRPDPLKNLAEVFESMAGRMEKRAQAAKSPQEQAKVAEQVAGLFTHPSGSLNVESVDEVKKLLSGFAKMHAKDLEADVACHGDPRQAQGFNKWQTQRTRQDDYAKQLVFGLQDQALPKMRKKLDELRTALGRSASPPQSLIAWLKRDYREFADRDEADLSNLMKQWLADAKTLMDRHPQVFPKPAPVAPVSDDVALNARLDKIGAYTVERSKSHLDIRWKNVAALANDLTPFELAFTMYTDNRKCDLALDEEMFRMWKSFLAKFPSHLRRCKDLLVKTYRSMTFVNEDAFPPDLSTAAILSMTTGGSVSIIRTEEAGETMRQVSVAFDIDWDEEHGFYRTLDDEDRLIQET